MRVLLVQILPHLLQDRRNRLQALPRCTVDQAAEDRRHERRRIQITAKPAAILPSQRQKRAHLRRHRTIDRQRSRSPALRLG